MNNLITLSWDVSGFFCLCFCLFVFQKFWIKIGIHISQKIHLQCILCLKVDLRWHVTHLRNTFAHVSLRTMSQILFAKFV